MSDKRATIRYDADGNCAALQHGGVDIVDGWPWEGDGTRGDSKSTALLNVHGGWKRDFTVAQLTAELRTREPLTRKKP